ncbi:hypothetical protein [Clostridium sp.]|uniref:hypothetical protein n=1 Tax=Clostridium sp. TaxID=1506 RepID=UPI00262303C1|nr:hypothetical protein [Clostridium sp.]
MAIFNTMVLTEKGQLLYAKGQAGQTINFTKLAVGIGNIGDTDPTTLTELVNRKFDIAIQGKTVNTAEKVALINGTLTNENMTESILICEIGLYAQDPDEGEILYSYASAGQYGDYTSPASNGPYSWNYQVYAAIGNAANVEVTLSNLQYDTGIINTNTTFSIIKGSTQNEINKSIDNKLKIYPTTNNGNVYTISDPDIDTLEDGYPIKVRFNANSTGNISLIVNNSSEIDVVDYFGNNVANVRNGLIANLIYDKSNSNFQLLGKGGEGDATPEQILINKKVTVNSGVIIGTMANNGAVVIKPSTSNQAIATGYHNGSGYVEGDANLLAANIISGISIFEVAGSYAPLVTVSGTAITLYNDTTLVQKTGTTPQVAKTLTCYNQGGVITVYFGMCAYNDGFTSYAQIYVNGVARGTLRTTTTIQGTLYFTEDVAVNVGDVVQIYAWNQTNYTTGITAFRITCGNNYARYA